MEIQNWKKAEFRAGVEFRRNFQKPEFRNGVEVQASSKIEIKKKKQISSCSWISSQLGDRNLKIPEFRAAVKFRASSKIEIQNLEKLDM
jgi:hypothetical protein